MVKSVIKEFMIMILILFVVILLLAIWLYDYYPANKTVPSKLAEYALQGSVKEELEEKIKETENIVVTYKIQEEDLASYEKTNEYDRGKNNPFRMSAENTSKSNTILNTVGK